MQLAHYPHQSHLPHQISQQQCLNPVEPRQTEQSLFPTFSGMRSYSCKHYRKTLGEKKPLKNRIWHNYNHHPTLRFVMRHIAVVKKQQNSNQITTIILSYTTSNIHATTIKWFKQQLPPQRTSTKKSINRTFTSCTRPTILSLHQQLHQWITQVVLGKPNSSNIFIMWSI